MSNLADLIAQKAALEQKIAEARRAGRASAIAQIKSLMAEHGLTLADLGGKASAASPAAAKKSRKGRKVPAKYRDPASGTTWSGRGLQPKWLKAALANGRKLSDFAV
ncbi:MAG TPA: H-NS histone family protein [Burkholderiaceae bacterium]